MSSSVIGERIKIMRGRDSQEKLATRLGIHINTLLNYEKGIRIPNAEVLEKLLSIYPWTSAKWLISGQEPQIETSLKVNIDDIFKKSVGDRIRIVVETYVECFLKLDNYNIALNIEKLFKDTIEIDKDYYVLREKLKDRIKKLERFELIPLRKNPR